MLVFSSNIPNHIIILLSGHQRKVPSSSRFHRDKSPVQTRFATLVRPDGSRPANIGKQFTSSIPFECLYANEKKNILGNRLSYCAWKYFQFVENPHLKSAHTPDTHTPKRPFSQCSYIPRRRIFKTYESGGRTSETNATNRKKKPTKKKHRRRKPLSYLPGFPK